MVPQWCECWFIFTPFIAYKCKTNRYIYHRVHRVSDGQMEVSGNWKMGYPILSPFKKSLKQSPQKSFRIFHGFFMGPSGRTGRLPGRSGQECLRPSPRRVSARCFSMSAPWKKGGCFFNDGKSTLENPTPKMAMFFFIEVYLWENVIDTKFVWLFFFNFHVTQRRVRHGWWGTCAEWGNGMRVNTYLL